MTELTLIEPGKGATPIWPLAEADYPKWLSRQPASVRGWLEAHRFQPKPGRFQTVPSKSGELLGVVLGVAAPATLWNFAGLSLGLPAGAYRIELPRGSLDARTATVAALGWAHGTYRFER